MSSLRAHRLATKLLVVFLFEILLLTVPSISQGDVNSAPLESNSILVEPQQGSVSVEIDGAGQDDGGVTLVFTSAGQGVRWQQRFYKVYSYLELRVDSSSGTLIQFEGRGTPGKYTWKAGDPEAETQDISRFVGSGATIRLWARVHGPPDRRCIMDTLADGLQKLHWEFTDTDSHQISR